MRVFGITILIFFTCFFNVAQAKSVNSEELEKLINQSTTNTSNFDEVSIRSLQKFIASNESKDFNNIYQLQSLYLNIHRKFLKNYKQYSEFGEVFTSGNYDCLTATTLYAYIFNELNIDYGIVKNEYHIFLKLKTNSGNVLIETTDALNGFVKGEEIKSRIESYISTSGGKFDSITYSELSGLLLFNQAVRTFNSRDFTTSFNLIIKALDYTKTEEMFDLLGKCVDQLTKETDLSSQEKVKYIDLYENLLISGVATL